MVKMFDDKRVSGIQKIEDIKVQKYLGELEQIYRKISNPQDNTASHITHVLDADRTSRSLRLHISAPWDMEESAQAIAVDIHRDILSEIERNSVPTEFSRQLRFTEAITNLERRYKHFQTKDTSTV